MFTHWLQHPLMLVGEINYSSGWQVVIFLSLFFLLHLLGGILVEGKVFYSSCLFICITMDSWVHIYLVGYNPVRSLFNLMPSLFHWEILLADFCVLFTGPKYSLYLPYFWHTKRCQAYLELSLSQPWNQTFLWGSEVPLRGECFYFYLLIHF